MDAAFVVATISAGLICYFIGYTLGFSDGREK